MKKIIVSVFVALFLFNSGIVMAQPGKWKGPKEKAKFEQKHGGPHVKHGPAVRHSKYFNEQARTFVHQYYADQFRKGHCPPGLAKKKNGCIPPGQAKKWRIGRPLPREVIFHNLPPEVIVHLGPVPSRHRFVRVAKDILLIAVGTGMVVDAIEDLGREF